ncbi:MAG: NAD(P)/FAD-dependent oxidoreductase [Candidatus Binatia bacterium]|nr:NAD(P)/FAD-dependent oxidoreductase [Candidatus Binatia bacterium]
MDSNTARSYRSAEQRPLKFAVFGAGMAGILCGIKLKEAGLSHFTIYEKADRVGGTWRENTYPGIACDVPAHLYTYSFAPNPDWSHRFAPGAEIQAYFERVAADYGIYPFIRFGDEVRLCRYDHGRWWLETARGYQDRVDVIFAATGVLHHPKLPDIEGLDTFAGACFHSARWDHSVPLEGKRVGVVGTGSSAVQIVSAIVSRVQKLVLFQRTAQWIFPQDNPPYSEAEKEEFRRNPARIAELREQLTRAFVDNFSNVVVDADSPQIQFIEDVCRAHLEQSVTDPVLREKLRPNYRAACKRLVVSPDFYQAIQRPNAELVTEGIARVEPRGVRTQDGRLHELDVLVLATGFQVDRFLRPIEVIGRYGKRLDDVWRERPYAYLSISIPDFPNLFLLNGPNGPVGNFSLIDVAELQFAYIMQLVELLRAGQCREISASEEATNRFEHARVEAAKKTVWVTGCRSWYLDDRGIPMAWPWTFEHFRAVMARPDFTAFELVA